MFGLLIFDLTDHVPQKETPYFVVLVQSRVAVVVVVVVVVVASIIEQEIKLQIFTD